MRNPSFWWILAGIMLILDWYVFQSLKTVMQPYSERYRTLVISLHWTLSVMAVLSLILFPYFSYLQQSAIFRNYVFAILVGLFLAKMVASLVFITDDIRRGVSWIVMRVFSRGAQELESGSLRIPRSVFMSWLGLGLGGTLFGSLLIGFRNKYNYQVKKISLSFNNLPAAFKGLRIVHISDIHSGSLDNHSAVAAGVELIKKQQPDLVLFTGDLVNNKADEMDLLQSIFAGIQAPMGVYSTLGNHDYGDYVAWPSIEAKQANLAALKKVHANMGWRLLMNEHVILEKGSEKIALLGIENWGAKGRFPKYGRMQDAYPGTENIPFKILMSHDPSHWDAQVRTEYPDIALMLSGHTHGMQFGLENPFIKWSPVQWMYRQWAGLYEEGNQKLYVNRGFGFLGYPGRVGILPEITVIELV
ncbi:MAG: metallophosphoesterase [Sediminibacterium sp.]|nr:metallophosphoesterase [Sediminibacterium sp.]